MDGYEIAKNDSIQLVCRNGESKGSIKLTTPGDLGKSK
jgi:hypothetical protein